MSCDSNILDNESGDDSVENVAADKKPKYRKKQMLVYLSDAEHEAFKIVAAQLQLSLAQWVRITLRAESGHLLRKWGNEVPFDPGNIDDMTEDKDLPPTIAVTRRRRRR